MRLGLVSSLVLRLESISCSRKQRLQLTMQPHHVMFEFRTLVTPNEKLGTLKARPGHPPGEVEVTGA